MTRTSILIILVDQMAAGRMSVHGLRAAKIPAMEQLSSSGGVFENCYCNGPMCLPSLASIFSGRLVSSVDAFDNGCEFPAQLFDLEADSQETANVISESEYQGAANRLQSRLETLCDNEEPRNRILASQRQRTIINAAHSIGMEPSWDHDPSVDPRTQYVRTDAQRASRLARHPQSAGDRS